MECCNFSVKSWAFSVKRFNSEKTLNSQLPTFNSQLSIKKLFFYFLFVSGPCTAVLSCPSNERLVLKRRTASVPGSAL